ncbi:glycosyltransferase family 2 protein [Hahella sp. CR1]|uniref:glycosyltransferase family A protein n=1 Tax=Hahella sp. CR1 TaxID=2992807 RepID=UPI0024429DDE|nr:glycosyltransferase family A protein [Hahella sp. CR1]MDG9672234.1 glycosyltransferase family 2 protein [Hahella sp. CR1]
MSTPLPLISVVIPSFNCLKYLPHAVNSVLEQDYPNLELIIVDDGSTDGSREWLRNFTLGYDGAVTALYDKGLGAGGARNLGVSYAKGELVAFLDADDLWEPGKLERQVAYHQQNPDAVLSFTDYVHVHENNSAVICGCFEFWPHFQEVALSGLRAGDKRDHAYCTLERATSTLYVENVVGTSSVMVSRDAFFAVGGFDVSLLSASDWDLWLKLSTVGDVGFTLAQDMRYLIRRGAISRSMGKRLAAVRTILSRHMDTATAQDPQSLRLAQAQLAAAYRDYHRSRGEWWKATTSGMSAFLKQPTRRHLKGVINSLLAHREVRLQ